MIAWLLRKLRRKPKPVGPAHLYAPHGSILETFYGKDHCMYCPYVDKEQTLFTTPPCPRNLKELA